VGSVRIPTTPKAIFDPVQFCPQVYRDWLGFRGIILDKEKPANRVLLTIRGTFWDAMGWRVGGPTGHRKFSTTRFSSIHADLMNLSCPQTCPQIDLAGARIPNLSGCKQAELHEVMTRDRDCGVGCDTRPVNQGIRDSVPTAVKPDEPRAVDVGTALGAPGSKGEVG